MNHTMKMFLLVATIAGITTACQKQKQINHNLARALDAERWLADQAIDGINSVAPDDSTVSLSLAQGVAGHLLFYLELHHASGRDSDLHKAEQLGRHLINNLSFDPEMWKEKRGAFSLYGDLCGSGIALTALFKFTKKPAYKKAANDIVHVITEAATTFADSLHVGPANDVLTGLSGTGLFLLYAYQELGNGKALELAQKAGTTLLGRAIETENDGLTWRWTQRRPFILPNFSHGPAGMAYFLTNLYEATGDSLWLETAQKATNYLDSIAKTGPLGHQTDVYLLPYGFPDPGWDRPYDIGWGHGPAGSGRLFLKLYQITGEKRWLAKAEAGFNGILAADPLSAHSQLDDEDVPLRKGGPQGVTLFGVETFDTSQRFGLAGVAGYAQLLYRATGNQRYLGYSTQVVDRIAKLADTSSPDQLHWPMPRFAFQPNAGDTTSFTGYFYGSAGYGLMFLNQHYAETGESAEVQIPGLN